MAHHCCRRFQTTIITMISDDGIWGVGCEGFFFPPPGRGRNSYIHRNSGDRFGEVYILVVRDKCPRASGAQQVTDRRSFFGLNGSVALFLIASFDLTS